MNEQRSEFSLRRSEVTSHGQEWGRFATGFTPVDYRPVHYFVERKPDRRDGETHLF
jgi:hypothetical protein